MIIDHSRKVSVYVMKNKSEVASKFIVYKNFVEIGQLKQSEAAEAKSM